MAFAFFKRKRFWKRTGIALAMLLGVALIANGVMGWWVERQLQVRIDRIRAAGDPASIVELKPTPVPDDRNAASILQQITPRLREYGKANAAFFDSPIGKQYEAAGDAPPTAEQVAAMQSILAKFPDVDAALTRAARCDEYASVLDYSADSAHFVDEVMAHQTPVRDGARFMKWQMEVDIATGHADKAVERGVQILRLARLFENEPTLISYLVGVAMRGIAIEELYDALSVGPVSAELHKELDEELGHQDDPQRLVRALKSEAALASGWSRWPAFQTDDNPYGQLHLFGWPLKWYLLGVYDYTNELIPTASRPWFEIKSQFGTPDTELVVTGHGKLADLLVPAVQAAFRANARGLALLRSIRIYNSLRVYAEKNGREATGLADLELPVDTTIDPFSGQPLKLKRTDEGWIVYSVMENGVDDGGSFKDLKDFGVAPWKLRSIGD